MSQQDNKETAKHFYRASAADFKKIPGSPIGYWLSSKQLDCFDKHPQLSEFAVSSNGVQTGNNAKYVRYWSEVSSYGINIRWFPYNKGGQFRRWYGNFEYFVNWQSNGAEIKSEKNFCARGEEFYFTPGITWSDITSGKLSSRYLPEGFLFDASGPSAFFKDPNIIYIGLALMNSKFSDSWAKILNPTLHFQSGDFRKLTLAEAYISKNTSLTTKSLVEISKSDWDAFEVSWDFLSNPLLQYDCHQTAIQDCYRQLFTRQWEATLEMQRLEEENNRLFIEAYGLQDELTPEVPLSEITLTCNPHYRYGGNLTDEEREQRLQSDTIAELISYTIGCMMGRYSLDREGLIYANAGNVGFSELVAEGAYQTFPADGDGILPLTSEHWFDDDVAARVEEFVGTVWGEEHLEENLQFIAGSLCLYAIKPVKNANETASKTIRRYLSTQFFKDHLKTYKKRPIYWLFSSGKEKAFECLVYLHRYNEATLPRMRTEYVSPLLGQMASRIELLRLKKVDAATAEAKRLDKEIDSLTKQLTELRAFDDQLKHYADMKITLDLDDGVKVNYGKFGNLLAEVKAITGDKGE